MYIYIYINYNLTEQCTAVVKHQMEGGKKMNSQAKNITEEINQNM